MMMYVIIIFFKKLEHGDLSPRIAAKNIAHIRLLLQFTAERKEVGSFPVHS